MKRNILFILLFLGTSLLVQGKTYYASPSGNGNGTAKNTPCSFSKGLSSLSSAGDKLYLLGGQYNLGNTKLDKKKGTANAYIVIAGYPGEAAILDFRNTDYGTRGLQISSNCQYVHIKDMTLRYSGKNNLYNEGSYCIFENLDIYGSADTGCQMKVGGYNKIINCDSHDNFDYQLDKSGNLTACDFGGNADGFADKQHDGAPNTYTGCRAWNNSDDGWDFFLRVTTGKTIIENCICYQNGPATYDMRKHGRYEKDKAWFDQFSNGKTVTDADGNQVKVTLDKYPNMGNGNGFKLGGGETAHKVEVRHCLAVGNTVKGFDQNNNASEMTVYNCSAYQNGSDYGFQNSKGTLLIRNCISYKPKSSNSFKTQTTSDHNSWNTSGISVSDKDFVSLDTTEILSDRKENGELPTLAFMHLQEGSKLIDAGTDVGLAYSGKAPDLGCYESGTDVSYPATLTCTEGSLTQSVRLGNNMITTILQWGGGATGVSYTALPAGIKAAENQTAKTLTFSGKPTETGTWKVTISTTGDMPEKTLTLHITVKDATSLQIAYVTIPNSDADKVILERLNCNQAFTVDIFDATQTNDYSGYDLVLLSPVPNSTAAGLKTIRDIDKPLIVLKPFMFKNTVWNWGLPQNTQDKSIVITAAEHPIFKGLSGKTAELFSEVNTNAVTCITEWYNCEITPLATTQDGNGTVIAEAKTGDKMNGTARKAPMLMIGVSEYSTAYLTETAVGLIENACNYLLGINPSTALEPVAENEYIVRIEGNQITVDGGNVRQLRLYHLSGQTAGSSMSGILPTSGLQHGIYILQINGNNYRKIRL